MIFVGIDDTDTLESRGTNQLARELVAKIASDYRCLRILRHQLLDDPRVPYTSKNGSASIVLEPRGPTEPRRLFDQLAEMMRAAFIPGSDPGLCVATKVPVEIQQYGLRCQRELIEQSTARELARRHGIPLIGLGGTEGGVIGALAAIGLAAGDNDGRVVKLGEWEEELSGPQSLAAIANRGVAVRELDSGRPIEAGVIDVGKKLRPNWRSGNCVLFVRPADGASVSAADFYAVKLV